MDLADRLKIARESTGKSQKDMAAELGTSFRAWQDYEAGKNYPGGKVFESLAKLGLDTNWLLTGEGKMWRPGFGPKVARMAAAADRIAAIHEMFNEPSVPADHGPDYNSADFVQVPRYEVAASAGGGAVIHSEQIVDYLSFRSDWVRNSLGVAVKDLALINVKGDSMEPTLSNEDLILIDLRTQQVEDNAVYVLQLNGALLVKRIQRKFDGSVTIMSDNTRYAAESLSAEATELLHVVGRVVWCGRRM